MKNFVFVFAGLVFLSSCVVSKKKFNELLIEKSALEVDKDQAKTALEQSKQRSADLKTEKDACLQKGLELTYERDSVTKSLLDLQNQYQIVSATAFNDANKLSVQEKRVLNLMSDIEKQNAILDKKTQELEAKSAALLKANSELSTKQNELSGKNKELDQKNRTLQKDQKYMDSLKVVLVDREKKVDELQSILSKQEAAVESLRSKITGALLSFSSDELQIEVKDGKVYVSLTENLLFKSGQYRIDTKGQKALQDLSQVLSKQKDVDIVVEGHTDDVPLNGAGTIKDNWDLSVMRATSVVRELQKNGVEPQNLVPAGRGEFSPKLQGKTTEIRAANRRIEIIISPSLAELYNLLENK